ncbi:MAG: hypothetical protein HZLCBSQH_001227 [Candidatus Fervidibacterota bacterium]
MQRLRGLVVALMTVGLMVGLGARSFAAPLLPPLPNTPPFPVVAGESKLAEIITPNDFIRIDWIVQDATPFGFPNFFAYLYQIENTTGTGDGIRSFNVSFSTSPLTIAGVLGGDNLDSVSAFHAAHTAANFPNLGPPPPAEVEPIPGTINPSNANDYSVFISPTGVSWNINNANIPPGSQSITLFIIDPRPPMYGMGVAQDSGKQWRTGQTLVPGQFGDPVPVPSPEPATLVLLSLGLGIVGFLRRRTQ